MQIRTDDDVYRVDAVWLGPPRATFPWRARYSSYGVGLIVMILVMFVQRRLGIPLGFFSVAWALVITVVVVRFVSRRIDEDRPLLDWLLLFWHELRGPRRRTRGVGSGLRADHVRIEARRPRTALPPGRSDPHASLAVPDRTADGAGASPAPSRGRRGVGRRRTWTTGSGTVRGGDTAAGRSEESTRQGRPAAATRSGRPGRSGRVRGVLRVTARRADRPARPTGPRRHGPSPGADEAPGRDAITRRRGEETDGAGPTRP